MYSVFIADDEPSVIEGLKLMIDWNQLGYEICGNARDANEAMEEILLLRPRLVITDIRMPGMNGLEMIGKLRQACADVELIILSGYPDFTYAQQAIREQVRYYFLKPLDADELRAALEEIKRRLDAAFYAMSPEYLEGFDSFNESGGSMFRDYTDGIKSAVLLMNEQEAVNLIEHLFEAFEQSRANRLKTRVLVNSVIYQILKVAYERNVEIIQPVLIKPVPDETLEQLKARLYETVRFVIQVLLDVRRQNTKLYLLGAKKFIESHFDSEIKMTELAGQVHVDHEYLGKCFKKEYNCSVSEYQHRLRIEQAIRLLTTTNMTLNDISIAVGYSHYNKFFEQFKKITGQKPTTYRKRPAHHI